MLLIRNFSLFALVLSLPAWGGPPKDEPVKLLDSEGKLRAPLGGEASGLNVFFFVRRDCPISNQYAPEMSRLEHEFTGRGVAFWLVYPDADETAEAIEQHRREYALKMSALRDPRHVLVNLAGIQVSPEAAVFNRESKRLYAGRIDNRYAALGQVRPEATVHDLENALTSALLGHPVAVASTPAVGCILEPAE